MPFSAIQVAISKPIPEDAPVINVYVIFHEAYTTSIYISKIELSANNQ